MNFFKNFSDSKNLESPPGGYPSTNPSYWTSMSSSATSSSSSLMQEWTKKAMEKPLETLLSCPAFVYLIYLVYSMSALVASVLATSSLVISLVNRMKYTVQCFGLSIILALVVVGLYGTVAVTGSSRFNGESFKPKYREPKTTENLINLNDDDSNLEKMKPKAYSTTRRHPIRS